MIEERGAAGQPLSEPGIPDQETTSEEPGPGINLSDLARREQTSFDNGFAQGMKTGAEAAEQKMEAAIQRYSDAIAELKGLKKSLYMQVERDVVKLAVEVAKKIVHREIAVDPDIIRTLVRVALGHVTEKSPVTIQVNPVDYHYMMNSHAELSTTEGRDIVLVADNSIQQGGCIIQTDCGEVDARIDEKFREVEHAFFNGCGRHGKQ